MATEIRAVEVGGVLNEDGQVALDEPLRAIPPGRVRLIVLASENATTVTIAAAPAKIDTEEREWLSAAMANAAFAFLSDPAEDVYTSDDGQPFRDEHSR